MNPLGTLDELPKDYVAELSRANLVPLWPSMRALLPPQAPRTATLPAHWRWRLRSWSCSAPSPERSCSPTRGAKWRKGASRAATSR